MKLSKSRLYRFYVYFKRAWMNYLVLPINIFNFITIQYKLLIEHSMFSKYIPNFVTFAILCVITIFVMGVIIGYWDFHRGVFKEEVGVQSRNNPYFWDQYTTVKKIAKMLEEMKEKNE